MVHFSGLKSDVYEDKKLLAAHIRDFDFETQASSITFKLADLGFARELTDD